MQHSNESTTPDMDLQPGEEPWMRDAAEMEQAWRDQQEQPGKVFTREVNGRIFPIRPQACPEHEMFAQTGDLMMCCGSEEDGTCCGSLFGLGRDYVLCDSLRPSADAPRVALVALQKREKLPPPHNLN